MIDNEEQTATLYPTSLRLCSGAGHHGKPPVCSTFGHRPLLRGREVSLDLQTSV